MKNILTVLLCAVLALTLCACADAEAPQAVASAAQQTEPAQTTAPTEAGEPWTLFETVFMPIANGEVPPEMDDITAFLDELGYGWPMFEGMLTVEDPERPGSYLSAAFGEGGHLSQISYHYVIREGQHIDEFVQRAVMIRYPYGIAQYLTNVDWLENGTEVGSPQELADYMMFAGLRPEETPEGHYRMKMTGVLEDTEELLSNDLRNPEYQSANLTLSQYAGAYSDQIGQSIAFTKAAAVDMDGDGFQEVVLWITRNEASDDGVLVLRYRQSRVYGQMFSYRQLFQLKTDGTFWCSGGEGSDGAARLVFDDMNWHPEPVSSEGFEDKENVRWVDFENYPELFG